LNLTLCVVDYGMTLQAGSGVLNSSLLPTNKSMEAVWIVSVPNTNVSVANITLSVTGVDR